jgi:hypothetical protein
MKANKMKMKKLHGIQNFKVIINLKKFLLIVF